MVRESATPQVAIAVARFGCLSIQAFVSHFHVAMVGTLTGRKSTAATSVDDGGEAVSYMTLDEIWPETIDLLAGIPRAVAELKNGGEKWG